MVGGESPGAGCDLWPLMSRSAPLVHSLIRGLGPGFVRCSSFIIERLGRRLLELSLYYTIPSTRQPMRHLNACLTWTRPTARGPNEPHSYITDEGSIMRSLVMNKVAMPLVDCNITFIKVG